jgi:hypothetical protein
MRGKGVCHGRRRSDLSCLLQCSSSLPGKGENATGDRWALRRQRFLKR